MGRRAVAHTSVQCSVLSPCKEYAAFGTNFGLLYVFPLSSLVEVSTPDNLVSPLATISCGRSVHCLLSKSDHLWIGVTGRLLVIFWPNITSKVEDLKTIELPISQPTFEMPSVNSLVSLDDSDIIYAGCSDGRIYSISLANFKVINIFNCHDQPIYSFSAAGLHELLSCSEDGKSCFWDHRDSCENWRPVLTFTPSDFPELQRPSLGKWITVGSVQSTDPDWFVLGGGPKLALWNKKAAKPTMVLDPKEQSPQWFPLVSGFVNSQVDPKIVAGGTSGSLIAWDFSGSQLFETSDLEDPLKRMTSILTLIEVPGQGTGVAGQLLVAGLSPSIHFISSIGYPSRHIQLPSDCSQKAQESTSEKYRPKKIWFDGVPHALIKASCEDTTDPILVKSKSFSGLTRTIALDCEFVGVGYEGRDDALARVSVVNQFGHILLDEYVRPREKVIDYRTPFSGVTPHHLRKGGPAKNFNTVQTQVAKLCKDRILVGHAVHNDLKVLMLSHPKRDIRDTSRYRPFRDLFNGRYPSLKALTERVLGVGVQQGEHDSVEDARATMRLYTIVKKIWEAQVKAHRAGKSSKEIQRLSHHLHFPSAINETNEQKPKVEPTRLAKIALDVSSEFMPGIPHTNGTPKTGMQRKPDSLVSIDKRPRQVAMVNGRKCSKHRQRFLEKRRRIRQRKLVTSSKKRPSLFS